MVDEHDVPMIFELAIELSRAEIAVKFDVSVAMIHRVLSRDLFDEVEVPQPIILAFSKAERRREKYWRSQ